MASKTKSSKRIDPEFLLEKYGKAKVRYETDGNFTIALVKYRRQVEVGIAKRNPTDPFVPERGQQIALHRALKKLYKSQ